LKSQIAARLSTPGSREALSTICNLQSAIGNPSVILTTVLIKILYVVLVLSTVALLWAAAAAYVRVRRHLAAKHEGLAGSSEEEHPPRQAVRGG
jgi:hypothetical protein